MQRILKSCLKNIICISLFAFEAGNAQVLFTPFEDESSYKGKWELSFEIPNYIAAYLRELHSVTVLSSSAFKSLADKRTEDKALHSDFEFISNLAGSLGYKFVLTGKILEFNISRFTAGDPVVAGYEAYSCNIEINLQIYNINSNSTEYNGTVVGEINNRGLGLTLLGKPTDEKIQYLSLNEIKFGSEEFNETIVGQTMFALCQNFSDELTSSKNHLLSKISQNKIVSEIADKSLDDIKLNTEIKKGKILTYDKSTREAFINLGSANDLKVGEDLSVYSISDSLFDPTTNEFLGLSDKKISILEIIEVRGDKLSLAVVKSNFDEVAVGMEVRKLVLKRKE